LFIAKVEQRDAEDHVSEPARSAYATNVVPPPTTLRTAAQDKPVVPVTRQRMPNVGRSKVE
jgi:hypothetical protein